MTLAITACLWDANETSFPTSLCYDETWALKLANAFKRNLSVPHRFVLFTDRQRNLPKSIEQVIDPSLGLDGYGACIAPFQLDAPMIFVGLDTLIVGNCDKLAQWAIEHPGELALPKDPYKDVSINGVVICGAGNRHIFDAHRGENDMEWLRQFRHHRIDALWPDKILSYKAHVRGRSFEKPPRIIYFHGSPKMGALAKDPWVKAHWR